MTDTKKPKLSEIRASVKTSPEQVAYLLYLVSRMGKVLDRCDSAIETAIYNEDGLDGAEGQRVIAEARGLLEEIKL